MYGNKILNLKHDNKIKSAIGIEVKRLRKNLGLTQLELGEKLDIDAAYISKIERGIKPISSIQLFSLLSICEQNSAIEFVIKIVDLVNLNEEK